MKEKRQKKGTTGLTRRQFLVTAGAVTAVGASITVPKLVRSARAAVKDHIMIGYVNPATGPLAAFGEPSPWVDERCLAEINKDGGIYIEEAGKNLPVKWKKRGFREQPDQSRGVGLASDHQ